ncbi:dynamin family protein [Rhexocercosporidium sp. MPI-PUGE-AT-0058]|nr:dynamin family protein [Rhexocercosporidium sp. MPI-PUGE-AT-0058]
MAPAAAHSDPPSFYETLTSHTLGQEQRALLDLIDDLRSSSLSSDIELPQIVVVGDQSAGKSSVLTAITGVHFPRDAYACTRFPTEVRLRRAKDAGTMVQILPGKILPGTMRSEDEQRRLAGFRRCLEPGVELANLLNEATTLIESLGLSGKFASRDRLRVDCWGPDKGHLSFVDLPGLVKVSNNDQTDEDREAIEEIADEYMHSPRAIILAVIGGNSDYIQQTVLSKVKQFDPQGLRTLGVLTKPDLVASIGQEDKFLSLVNGAEHNFKLGWHVLLNADTNVVWSRKEREVHEKNFFSKGKWREVPEEKWGADRLWSRVSVQLSQQIARHIPSLLEDIEKELVKCEADLEALGVGCVTTEEMKSQLSNFFSASKFLIDEAVEGRYRNYRKGPKFFPITPASEGTPIQHLRARVVEENKCFVEKIETQGRKLTITEEEPPVLSNASDLAKQVSRKEYIRTVVDPMLEQNTGMEQEGDYNPSLIYRLFQDYSAMWDGLAKAHETDVEVLCRTFLEDVVHCVWPERMREPLWSHLLNKGIEEASKQAKEEVKRLVEDRELYVRAYDPAYSTRVKDWKKKQIEEKHVPSEGEVYLEKMLIYYDVCRCSHPGARLFSALSVFIGNSLTPPTSTAHRQNLHQQHPHTGH